MFFGSSLKQRIFSINMSTSILQEWSSLYIYIPTVNEHRLSSYLTKKIKKAPSPLRWLIQTSCYLGVEISCLQCSDEMFYTIIQLFIFYCKLLGLQLKSMKYNCVHQFTSKTWTKYKYVITFFLSETNSAFVSSSFDWSSLIVFKSSPFPASALVSIFRW